MTMDLTATINHFGVDYTVRRVTGADTIGADGFEIPAATSNVTVKIHIEPAKQQDMLMLPEGKRFESGIVLLSADELKAADVATGKDGDVIEYQSSDWEVVHAERWVQGQHWRAIAIRRGR